MFETIIGFFREAWRSYRHREAERVRWMIRREILIKDADDFFAGKKTAEESLAYRDKMYRRLDIMSDDEVLE